MTILRAFRSLRPRIALLLSLFLFCVITPAVADDWPTRPITLINPYPAGSAMDVALRLIGQEITNDLGQPAIVESKPGGGATISAAYVARSAPDGYTLLGSTSQHAVTPWIMKGLPYQYIDSFTPVAMVAESPFVLVVRPGLNVDSVPQLVELIKGRGTNMNYGSTGPGSLSHLAGVMLNNLTGVKVTHVPFQGGAPAFTALLGGQIDYLFADVSSIPSVLAGKVKALAVTTEKRFPQLPNVPAMSEFYPDFKFMVFVGLEAPAGTPRPVVDKLAGTMKKALRSSAFVQRLNETYSVPRFMGPDEFSAFKIAEFKKNEQFIQEAGVKAE